MRSAQSTWRFPSPLGSYWPVRREVIPTIVADALTEIGDPLRTVLRVGCAAPAGEVARAIARSLAPCEADGPAPSWLRPEQVPTFRRALAAIECHGGALLADPVGSGKTWIALAIARVLAGREATVALVPAALRDQWRTTAARLELPLTIVSHQAASRGALPGPDHSLVIIDESHHFRNPTIRRYQHAAPWLVGRPVLLLSGTPVVNRLMDLCHQLLLAVRDDCLRGRGYPSLRQALESGRAPSALDDLVLCRPRPRSIPIAARRVFPVALSPAEGQLIGAIERLALSRDPGIAALIRIVLWRALGSSPAALAGALARYARLLHHATLASASGVGVTRAAIRAFAGRDQEQLVLWDLFPEPVGPVDLALQDRAPLELLLRQVRTRLDLPDTKCEQLAALLQDGVPTIVFTGARDTLSWLRVRLADRRPAWLTGEAAGIGVARMARGDVLEHFSPRLPAPATRPLVTPAPHLLLTTDVAAEGLDLQGAGRVVHYDLPWTSVRLEQRNGRALRLGAQWNRVEVVEFHPPAQLEGRLGQLVRLAAKRRLSSDAGIDSDGRWLYRWRSDLATWAGPGPVAAGMSVVEGSEMGWLIGLALDAGTGQTVQSMPACLLWIGDDGRMSDDPEELTALLQSAAWRPWRAPSTEERQRALTVLAPVVRARLQETTGKSWPDSRREPEQGALERRLRALATRGARERNRALLQLLDAALAWLGGGLSAGEVALVRRASQLETSALVPALRRLLAVPRRYRAPVPRLTGVVRVGSLSACPSSAPSSLISTAR